MVKISFERPGLDTLWGATEKDWNGFPSGSTAMYPRAGLAESEEEFATEEVVDMQLHPEEHFDLMTALSEQLANEETANLGNQLEERFELKTALSQDVANDKNYGVKRKPEEDSKPMTQSVPAGDQIAEQSMIAFAPESEKNPAEERQQANQEGTVPKMECPQHQQETETQPTSLIKRRRPDCFGFFGNLFKSRLADKAKPDLEQALLTGALSDLDTALIESASFNEAKELSIDLARVRLQNVMEKYRTKVQPVKADGNCQFRALALQLHGDEGQHGLVRAGVVKQLQNMKGRYSDFVHEPYEEYIERMACDGEWGDNVTLQAASDMLCRDIHVLNDQPGAEHISLHPAEVTGDVTETPLWLAFLAEVHYDAVEFI